VNTDTELEAWQREWREQTEPLPELKKKIKRQNLRTLLAIAATVICLVLSTTEALRGRGSFMTGLALGIWFASLSMGSYAWWVRRGAWKPEAQTTRAYAELAYKRAVARAGTLRFGFYFLLIATILYAAFAASIWRTASGATWLVLFGMVIELFFFSYLRRRKRRDVEEARELMDQTNQDSDVIPTER